MTNEVVNGVIAAIKAAYPTIDVYDEDVEQGLVEPSFSVRCVRPSEELYRDKRYHKTHLIEVLYFPPREKRNQNSNAIIEALFSILEYITAGNDLIRGSRMNAYMDANHIVVFTVTYDYYVLKIPEAKEEEMQGFVLEGVKTK